MPAFRNRSLHNPPLYSGQHIALGSAPLAEGPGEITLLPRDSAVAVLVTTAECAAARAAAPEIGRLASELRRSGVAFRVVVKSRPQAAHQYARLYPRTDYVVRDATGAVLGSLEAARIPGLIVLDRTGAVVGRYTLEKLTERGVTAFAEQLVRAATAPGRGVPPM